jgi:hypothetical protein
MTARATRAGSIIGNDGTSAAAGRDVARLKNLEFTGPGVISVT